MTFLSRRLGLVHRLHGIGLALALHPPSLGDWHEECKGKKHANVDFFPKPQIGLYGPILGVASKVGSHQTRRKTASIAAGELGNKCANLRAGGGLVGWWAGGLVSASPTRTDSASVACRGRVAQCGQH